MAEYSEDAHKHVEAYASVTKKLGWRQQGPLDKDIACDVCRPKSNGEPNVHGVDALFEFDCPYSERPRLVLVDGKQYKMDSIGGKSVFLKWMKDLARAVEHLNGSRQALLTDRAIPEEVPLDIGVIAWDCPDWDRKRAVKWMKTAGETTLRREPAVLLLLSTRDHLSRMLTISKFIEKHADVQFAFHREGRHLQWSSTVPPEAIHSHFLMARHRTDTGKLKVGALHFGHNASTIEARAIIHRFLSASPDFKRRHLWSTLPQAQASRLGEYIATECGRFSVPSTSIKVKHTPITLYQSR